MSSVDRREFMRKCTALSAPLVFWPLLQACDAVSNKTASHDSKPSAPTTIIDPRGDLPVPLTKPINWDPIDFNRQRANAGAVPASYLIDINGPEGDAAHLGKHLPYLPNIDHSKVPPGLIALMWGNPELGHHRHPNDVPGPSNENIGHWYNWIQIRKAGRRWHPSALSIFSSWPTLLTGDSGRYAVYGQGDLSDEQGQNTIYLAQLPPHVGPGDTLRVWSHCLTHGEYVDFMQLSFATTSV